MTFIKHRSLFLPFVFFVLIAGLTSCATTQEAGQPDQPATAGTNNQATIPAELNRPVPNPVANEIPPGFYQAVENGTRTMSGEPGPKYWQQYSTYSIDVELDPANKKVNGKGTIVYQNNSPDTLNVLFLEIIQNLHKEGVVRNEGAEITGGMNFTAVGAGGTSLSKTEQAFQLLRGNQPGYYVDGTLMMLKPSNPVMPGDSIKLDFDWNFKVPQRGAGGRMGHSEDNLFYIGYWYPKMRVYDDIIGWFTDPFRGNAEFYHEFGDYRVNITAPEQWIVAATGVLENAQEVLSPAIYKKLEKAYSGDEVVNIVSESDFGKVTRPASGGKITWSFSADKVRDFAFSATTESIWDATRTNVGDIDGDGNPDYARINAFYRSSAPLWKDAAEFTAHSIGYLSAFTGMSYPWPHMTAVEGGGIIGGGMEYPMMTLMGTYNGRSPQDLYAVTAHEIAHMWVPMMVSSNERRYSWLDEGTTTFNEAQAKKDYYSDSNIDFEMQDMMSYLSIAGTGFEGEVIRWSDYHYNGSAYGVASYPKPATLLVTLRGLLGEETFNKAYQTFLARWQYKHPYPWDLFNTFEDVSGKDLDWFWRSWYYETWILDQAVVEVSPAEGGGSRILVQDFGEVPMPAYITVTLKNGNTITRTIGVETWLKGITKTFVHVDAAPSEVAKVEIDPDFLFPDADRSNNIWQQ